MVRCALLGARGARRRAAIEKGGTITGTRLRHVDSVARQAEHPASQVQSATLGAREPRQSIARLRGATSSLRMGQVLLRSDAFQHFALAARTG